MSKMTWNRIGFFALGTFFGGWVLNFAGGLFGRRSG